MKPVNTIILILGDQLSPTISSLESANKQTARILMCEVISEANYVKHHKKKIAFIFSAMRHFAKELETRGYTVDYVTLDDPNNTGSFKSEVARALHRYTAKNLVVTQPSEYRVLDDMTTWSTELGISVDIRPDGRFLWSLTEFAGWAKTRKQLRLEYFYRDTRRRYTILMADDKPVGGKWNYDASNRKAIPDTLRIPEPHTVPIDSITAAVIDLVSCRFGDHFGDIHPFYFAVTRDQALGVLDQFIRDRLPYFGDYQDAMKQGEPWLYHSHISFYLNCGLLLPLECISAAETAYYKGQAPLNAVEGFIRQIIGWREYVRGIYWLKMPDYASLNFLEATESLPNFYWTAQTDLNCLRQCIQETKRHAYAHHIQRLMILGNFALLIGVSPDALNHWFLVVYADAYEWVELPNVSGMVLFADGGYLASKPYASGGSYINKLSNYCQSCRYSVTQKTGPDACPFNYLYWHFLVRNREKLAKNPRVAMMYRTYDRMSPEKQTAIAQSSRTFLDHTLREGD